MSPRDVRRFYGKWARLYDRMATLPYVARWRVRAAGALSLEPGDTVVEMGCGTGANLPYLREPVGRGGRVVGVDLTRPLLSLALARGRADASNVYLLRGDATSPPVSGADAVLGTFVVGMFDDPAGVVSDWCDLVGGGGRVALVNLSRTDRPAGRVLDPLFRSFVVASTPGRTPVEALTAIGRPGADDRLTARVAAARETLVDRCVDIRVETGGLGFVSLVRGRVP